MKMGDLELSLDDIIKKKLKKTGPFRNKNNAGNMKKPIRRIYDSNNRVTKPQSVGVASNKPRMSTTKNIRGKGPQPTMGDARFKIIQKQRQKMTDAREKLGQIAKQTDARLRLMKLRERQRGTPAGGRLAAPFRPELVRRTVQSRMNSGYYEDELMDYTEDVSYPNRNFDASEDVYGFSFRNRQNPAVLYRTVENDIPINRLYKQEKSIYTWTKPVHISEDITDIPVTRTSSRLALGVHKGDTPNWDYDDTPIVITKKIKPQETVGILKRSSSLFDGQAVKIIKESPPPTKSKGPARTLSERFCQEGNLSAQKISLLKAKLEASQKVNNNNSAETQPPLGHRIVVSNLVPSVTHEDVKELFEDIGELISSKVVRPGTAEVVYKLHRDAVKAVDVYHNRQLDGQPMKCLLVNNRLKTGAGGKVGKGVVELDMTAFRKALHKKSTS